MPLVSGHSPAVLLSQWRGYGEGGVAIGFNAERLVKSLPTRLMLQPVTYSKYTQRAMLEVLLKIFRKHLNKLNGGRGQQSKRALLNEACNSLAMILPLIKNDAFEEEKEWRLLKTSHISQEQSEVSHRVSNGLIVPYVRLKLSGKLPIERIVVGPSAHQSLLAEGIRDILARTNESSIDVELSSTPYRAR